MIRVVVCVRDANEGFEPTLWAIIYEGGVEQGRVGLSVEGTDALVAALRGANIPVTNLLDAPEDDEEPTDV